MTALKTSATANPIREYYAAIQRGDIIACHKITRTLEKLCADLDDTDGPYIYDSAKAEKVITFIEKYCKQSKGRNGGKGIRLELWQKAFIAATFGFVEKTTGFRKYRESVLIVGRKNGKSTIGSAIGNYMLFADKEKGPEIVSAATMKEQAKIVWLEAKRMVQKSPSLMRRAKLLVSEIQCKLNDGTFRPLSSDSNTLDGLNLHAAIIDELHAIKDRNLYDVLVDGMSAREQPLCLIISTAGTVREGIFDVKYSEAQDIINGYDNGSYIDEHVLFFVYELDDREEWQKPECFIKANPGLGTIKSLAQLQNKVKKAQHNPELVKNLLCKDFNMRETSGSAWLTFEALNNEERFDIEQLKPRYFIGGADLSRTTDLTCATAIFKKQADGPIYVMQMYWLPEDLLEERSEQDKIQYNLWVQQGLMRVCAGSKIRYEDVTAWFCELVNKYGMMMLWCGYDSWSAKYWVDDMISNFGHEAMEQVIQGKKTLSSPMHNMGADLKAKRIIYNNNPILKWCLSNTAIDIDINGNIQPMKANQLRRIDGTASLLDAYVTMEKHLADYNSFTL